MRRRLRPTRFGGRIAFTAVGICLGTVAVVYIYVVAIAGGGSGHGFKHGPAVGERMAELILKDREPEAIFQLARFNR